MENEALTMRRLCADDLFTMMRILSKIGVNDLRSAMPTKTAVQRVREGNESAETVGVTVARRLQTSCCRACRTARTRFTPCWRM